MFRKFKTIKGKLLFSDKIYIYEENMGKEIFFQSITPEKNNLLKNLNLYLKKIKKLSLTIFIEKFYYDSLEIAIPDEINEENISNYIHNYIQKRFEEDNLEEYFIKYFKLNKNKFKIFIFNRDFIEELIEFIIKNKLIVNNIFIKDDNNYEINDYNKIFKYQYNIPILFLFFSLFIIFIFSGLRFYNYNINQEIEIKNQTIITENNNINELKKLQEEIEKEILLLKGEKKNIEKKEYLKYKFFKILKIIPKKIEVEYIYYEKNNLNVKGITDDENLIFLFLENLEKEKYIKKIFYDYIINNENNYKFLIEIEVS